MSSKQKARARAHPEDMKTQAVGEEHAADAEHVADEEQVVDAEVIGAAEESATATEERLGEPDWRERASFAVSFDSAPGVVDEIVWRTRVYHDETDTRADWPGVAGAALVEWMGAQGKLPTESVAARVPIIEQPAPAAEEPVLTVEEPAPMAEEPAPVASLEPALSLQLSELLLAEVMLEQELGSWGRVLPGPVYARRLRSQIHFTLAGPAAIEATLNRSHYTVQISASTLASGEVQVLSSEQADLQPYNTNYSSRSEFAMPALGSYRVLATILLPDEGIVGVALGPVLTVMP